MPTSKFSRLERSKDARSDDKREMWSVKRFTHLLRFSWVSAKMWNVLPGVTHLGGQMRNEACDREQRTWSNLWLNKVHQGHSQKKLLLVHQQVGFFLLVGCLDQYQNEQSFHHAKGTDYMSNWGDLELHLHQHPSTTSIQDMTRTWCVHLWETDRWKTIRSSPAACWTGKFQ